MTRGSRCESLLQKVTLNQEEIKWCFWLGLITLVLAVPIGVLTVTSSPCSEDLLVRTHGLLLSILGATTGLSSILAAIVKRNVYLWVAALVSFPAMPLALSQLIFNALGLGGNTVCYNPSTEDNDNYTAHLPISGLLFIALIITCAHNMKLRKSLC